MAVKRNKTLTEWLTANYWVVLADIAGFALLVAVISAAAGSPALRDWIFVLLTGLPLIAAVTLFALSRTTAKSEPTSVPVAVAERKIVITPRPVEQRVIQAS